MSIISKKGDSNHWISFSDVMTGLMVIFMFIAISYMLEAQKKQDERDEIFKEFKQTKEDLYNELNDEFKNDFQEWKVVLDKDLSIKFINPDVLFKAGQSTIPYKFSNLLDDFLPRYFNILLKDTFRDKIAEIRIEGHTDMTPTNSWEIPYIGNLKLSQMRSASVMNQFISSPFYSSLLAKDRSWLQFNLTANGMSYGKTLDADKGFTYDTKNPVNKTFSRRVEFRIVTTSDKVVEKVLEEINNKK
ncbi:MAG: hypothetical protein COA58_03325 [Bacteroidetes bacterium]|nr:MAG: hypothetical protein COA58_03325 [Bacteroidota bacterium]